MKSAPHRYIGYTGDRIPMDQLSTTYVPVDAMVAANMKNCADGLYQSGQRDPLSNVLIVTKGSERFAIYLSMPEGPLYVPLTPANVGRGVGMLWPVPLIEIDPSSVYRPDQLGDGRGDLIVGNGPVEVVALQSGGWHDLHRLPLWAGVESTAEEPLGFKAWRLVRGKGLDRRVLFERRPDTV